MTHSRRIALLLSATLAAGTASASPRVPPWGVNLGYVDTSIKPGEDFFAYANGGWLKTAQIPADRPAAGVGLDLTLLNEERLKSIIAELHTRTDLTPEEQKLRDLYDAFTDERQIEAKGLGPASEDLARIQALATREDVAREMGKPGLRLGGPFRLDIASDDKNPDAYTVRLSQSGLGLPDRDYYLRDDAAIASTREAYKKYLAQMLSFAGAKDAGARAAAVYAMEHDIAVASWPAADRRDADKVYNPMTLPELKRFAPEYPWEATFRAAGIPLRSPRGDRAVVVTEKSAFPPIAKLFESTPVPVWRDFLTIRYLHVFAPYLPRAIDEADFAFYGTALQGRTKQLDRATRGSRVLDNQMGEALGKIYVRSYFPAESKAKVELLVRNLLQAYEEDLKTVSWMTAETRQRALDKLHHFTVKRRSRSAATISWGT